MAAAVLFVVALTGCGTEQAVQPAAQGTAGTRQPPGVPAPSPFEEVDDEPDGSGMVRPPDVRLRYEGGSLELTPYTFCYGNGCVDGMPQSSPDVGDPPEVYLDFALPDWRFEATLQPTGDRCGRSVQAPVERLGPHSFRIRPAGHPGTYRVQVFGRGNGDLATEFRWTTPTEGPLPRPEARLALVADHDGEPDSYGVELSVTNLDRTPHRVEATITGTAANGRSLTFTASRAVDRCAEPGSVYFDGPDASGKAVAALGPAPFDYRVVLVLDGRRYVATATWPGDEIRGNAPSVRLRFSPRLPGME